MENNSASAVVGQQHEAAQQKSSKKKSKNKKHNGKSATQSASLSSSSNGSNGQTDVDGEVIHTPHAELQIVGEALTNGLSDEVKQKLHIDSTENACKVNGITEPTAAATVTANIDHEPRTATQNGHHHHTANSQQHDNDDDGYENDHHHQKQQKHQKPHHEQTNGADALPSTATNNNNNNNSNNKNHNKKSKSSKSNKSKNKSNESDIDVDRGLQQQNQEQHKTQLPAHTAVASNGASVRKDQVVSGNTENGFSSNCSNSSSSGNSVDETKQTHNTNAVAEVAADVTHAKANQLSAHPAAATSVSIHDTATSSNTANKDIDSIASTTTTTATTTSVINKATANASNPAQKTIKTDSGNVEEETGDAAAADAVAAPTLDLSNVHIDYKEYESELQMHDIMRLIQAELSEPYSIYTYRYFIYNWPKLCFLAAHGNEYVGAIVCKLDMHMNVRRGYIAMLAVRKEYRKLKIGTTLVQKAIEAMLADNADEVVLETEMRNVPALRLYENLGFVRDKRLFRYYLNGVDALRLKLWFR